MTAAWSSIPTPSSGPCARSLSVERTPCSPLRQRREALGNHRHPDPVGEAERCRSTGLADRRARTHRVRTDQAARIGHSAAMELESGCSCGNPRHHIASAFGRSPSIAVAAQLALTTQTPRLIRRTASRQRITHHPSQAMWGVCNAYAAAAFAVGAALPLLMALATPIGFVVVVVAITSLLCLALLGVVGARIGGANLLKAAIRVTFWGALAMAITAGIGAVFGTQV